MENIVLVGKGSPYADKKGHNQKELFAQLETRGFDAMKIETWFPRDSFVPTRNHYVSSTDFKHTAEGGFFLIGKDIVFASEKLADFRIPEEKEKELSDLFGKDTYLMPVKEGIYLPAHIDYHYAYLSEAKVLIFDKTCLRISMRDGDIHSQAERAGVNVLEYNSSDCTHPLSINFYTSIRNGHDISFVDSKATDLIKILEQHSEVIPLDMVHPGKGGALHCMTNEWDGKHPLCELLSTDKMFYDNDGKLRYSIPFCFYTPNKAANHNL